MGGYGSGIAGGGLGGGENRSEGYGGAGGEEESIWDTAKKWAFVAGEKASQAEKEVWRRINQG